MQDMRENYTTVLNDIEGRAKIIDLNKIEINREIYLIHGYKDSKL